jgi:SAM-dependent methyltransferase
MSNQLLNPEQVSAVRARYAFDAAAAETLASYGTVRDYCDSCDHLPLLANAQGDLKDLQRPWAVKTILRLLPPGSRLLEIGGGAPLVAQALAELGYDVTLIDPYDGTGQGPTEFQAFVESYPQVRILRNLFQEGLPELQGEQFDGIYSISVLEHVPEPHLSAAFAATAAHLRPGGWSIHCVDCVTVGDGDAFHIDQCVRVLNHQSALAGTPPVTRDAMLQWVAKAHTDVETYFLSAAGHNLWRGAIPYDTFPFRKVISFQTEIRRRLENNANAATK